MVARLEKNRKQRKARFIRAKNQILRDPVCGNGVYWCNHLYDPTRPWTWVDFKFLSTRHKNRYFSTAMITCEHAAMEMVEEEAWNLVDKEFPERPNFNLVKAEIHPKYGQLWKFDETPSDAELFTKRMARFKEISQELAKKPVLVRPKIDVRLEYGPVAIGLHATVNTRAIDDSFIRQFIASFKEMGEPIDSKTIWLGDEVEVVPFRIYENY